MFTFEELDDKTREYMLREFRAEQSSTNPFPPADLTREGIAVFIEIMERALLQGNEQTLAMELAHPAYWNTVTMQVRRGKSVRVEQKVDVLARRLAETEFNTWYVRGYSKRLMDEGVGECEVYRAAPAKQQRSECCTLEGSTVSVLQVYEGHRARYHPVKNPTAFSIPVGPNCHHSIRRLAGP